MVMSEGLCWDPRGVTLPAPPVTESPAVLGALGLGLRHWSLPVSSPGLVPRVCRHTWALLVHGHQARWIRTLSMTSP